MNTTIMATTVITTVTLMEVTTGTKLLDYFGVGDGMEVKIVNGREKSWQSVVLLLRRSWLGLVAAALVTLLGLLLVAKLIMLWLTFISPRIVQVIQD